MGETQIYISAIWKETSIYSIKIKLSTIHFRTKHFAWNQNNKYEKKTGKKPCDDFILVNHIIIIINIIHC